MSGVVEVEEWEMTINDEGVSIWGDEKVVELDTGDGCTALQMYLMPLSTLWNGLNGKC